MNLHAEITAVTVNADDQTDFTVSVHDDDESGLVAFETVITAPLASFLAMRLNNAAPLDAFDQVIYAIESLNFTSKIAEELVGIEFTSTDE